MAIARISRMCWSESFPPDRRSLVQAMPLVRAKWRIFWERLTSSKFSIRLSVLLPLIWLISRVMGIFPLNRRHTAATDLVKF